MPEMEKNWRVTVFISEIMCVVYYTDFEKLSHVIEHGLQGFIAKNIESESTEANDRRATKNGIRWCILPKIQDHVYFVHPSTDISVNISTDS